MSVFLKYEIMDSTGREAIETTTITKRQPTIM